VDKPKNVRFEVFTAVTTKNGVFWDVTPCGSWFLQEPHGVISQKTPFFKPENVCILHTRNMYAILKPREYS
jgi:hypothetical protein